MEKIKYLPLGSVITAKGGLRKLIIVGRSLLVEDGGEQFYFDYAAAPYPVGVAGDKLIYLDQEAIDLVLFIGYADDDNLIMNDMINDYVETHPNLHRKDWSEVHSQQDESAGQAAD